MPSPPPHRRVVPRKKADLDELDLTAKRSAAPKGDFDPDDVEMTAERVRLDAGDSIEMTVQRPKLDRDSVPHMRPTPVPFADGTDDAPAPPPVRKRLDVRLPDPPRRSDVRPAEPRPTGQTSRAQPSGVHGRAVPDEPGDSDEFIYVDLAETPPSFPPVERKAPTPARTPMPAPSRQTPVPARPTPSRQTAVPSRPELDPSFRPTRETPVPRRAVPDSLDDRTGLVAPRRTAETPDTGLVAARPVIRTAHDSPTVVGAMPLPDAPPRERPAYEDALESPWSGDEDVDQRRASARAGSQPRAELRRSSQRFAAADPRTPNGRRTATPAPDSKRHARVDPRDVSRSQPRVDPRDVSRSQPRVDPRDVSRSQPHIARGESFDTRTPVFGSNIVKDEPGQKPTPYQFDPKAPVRGMPLSGPIRIPDAGHDDFAYEEPVAPEIAPTEMGAPLSEQAWDLPREPRPGDTFEMEAASFSDAEPTGIAAGPPVEIEDRPITNLDPGERGLLAAIAAGSESSRAKYADWLARHGEAARAEYMRAEQDLHHIQPNDPRRPVAVARLAGVAPRISMDWRSLVARSPIEGCSAAGQCPGVWNALPATDGDDHRVCATCTHPVFYCASLELAQKRRARGEYVAVDVLVERRAGDLNTGTMQCLNCGTSVPSDARFCPNCGQSIQQVFQMGGF